MGAYDTPTQECPYCKSKMEADWVDVGVGMVQCGPYHCYECGASEIGPELNDWYYKDRDGNEIYLQGKRKYYSWAKRGKGAKLQSNSYPILRYNAPFTKEELETGFYDPSKKMLSPYANTVGGHLVGHRTAKAAYNLGLLDEKGVN
ncbi:MULTISPECIES: hypothetical protein [Bacillus cereus group]|uniref:hypothetical protein n=1 Tax=Bacillus cereus group TaxID=86661 RepID=UPI0018CD61E0|nr:MULTISPECIES: hypothetical protein [Bacillus cereus group]MBG9837927.1 hypothetical protein [Bacillus tropicus]MBG9880158.1 hypothetical protein [Bacillus tropicus]MBG9923406.1 hypothetical protein [Bacillus tropicus]MBJ8355320.1 hypothetical protein [Bacillus mycoides]MED2903904.1 hypothetical protein [Bacillus tropicus]